MRKIDIDEMKRIQVELLQEVDAFCRTNNINYWLDCGTLLGAIRHKGFIPWDDDIDIGMLRPDYDKFMQLFNKEHEHYKAYSIENKEGFLYPFIKIMDTRTVLYEPDEKGAKLSVAIDLFVYDNAPDDERKLRRMYRKRDLYISLHNIRSRLYFTKQKPVVYLMKCIMYPFLLIFPKTFFVKRIVKNAKRYSDMQTKSVGNFTSYTKFVANKKIFSEFINVEFEGRTYRAPIGYDEWLKLFYNDYMTLPPLEKRVSHHEFKAFIEESNEKI